MNMALVCHSSHGDFHGLFQLSEKEGNFVDIIKRPLPKIDGMNPPQIQ